MSRRRLAVLVLATAALTGACRGHVSTATAHRTPMHAAAASAGASAQAIPAGMTATSEEVRFALISADGRHVTVTATGGGCTRTAHLAATEFADRVELRLDAYQPAVTTGGCTADLVIWTESASLSAPLGHRRLVDRTRGTGVQFFDGRRLAQVTWLPPGAGTPRDRPEGAGWTRVFPFPKRRTASPITVTQTATKKSRPPYTPNPMLATSSVRIHGHPGLLVVQRDDHGRLVQDSVLWVEDGYAFTVASSPEWGWQRPLDVRRLLHVADGLRLPG